jgi:hypothetical protein
MVILGGHCLAPQAFSSFRRAPGVLVGLSSSRVHCGFLFYLNYFKRSGTSVRGVLLVDAPLCRYVRVYPVGWETLPALRLELFGVAVGAPLGLADKRIPDRALSATSVFDETAKAAHARIKETRGARCWRPAPGNTTGADSLTVTLNDVTLLSGIELCGSGEHASWPAAVVLQHSLDGEHWVACDEWVACTNAQSSAVLAVDPPVLARFVRVCPTAWESTAEGGPQTGTGATRSANEPTIYITSTLQGFSWSSSGRR